MVWIFLSGLFIAIAAFFGFGQVDKQLSDNKPVVEVAEENTSLSGNIQNEKVVVAESEDTPNEGGILKAAPEVDVEQEILVEEELETQPQVVVWQEYKKPSKEVLQSMLDPLTFKVTQEEGTERSGTSWLDKNWEEGIYVDVLSGEPLYSSKDKYDSGTGWPSFTQPIISGALTLHEDNKLFSKRIETRSAIADNHIGHVFTDGPKDKGGLRYCMNGVALKFIPKAEMEAKGYGEFLQYI